MPIGADLEGEGGNDMPNTVLLEPSDDIAFLRAEITWYTPVPDESSDGSQDGVPASGEPLDRQIDIDGDGWTDVLYGVWSSQLPDANTGGAANAYYAPGEPTACYLNLGDRDGDGLGDGLFREAANYFIGGLRAMHTGILPAYLRWFVVGMVVVVWVVTQAGS